MNLYDPQCHELANHFLGDDDVSPAENELRIQSLAAAIQQAVEDWIQDEERSTRGPISETAPDRCTAGHVRRGKSAGRATDGHESARERSQAR